MRALQYLAGHHWAMDQSHLETMASIANREGDISPEALEKYRASALNRTKKVGMRDGVAVIGIHGSLFRRANLLVEYSGGTDYETVRRDLQVALDTQDVSAILLDVDSPGGECSGCGELASAIRAASAIKPVHAYVGGTGASGAYWIASATTRITVDPSALLGSIGVLSSFVDTSARDERLGIRRVEIVSSLSPAKRPDLKTDEGRATIVKVLDDLAGVFVADIARYRGVSEKTVLEKFGKGGVLVGAKAVAAGMADGLGSFEGALDALRSEPQRRRISALVAANLAAARSAPVAAAQPTAPVVDQDAIRASWATIAEQRTSTAAGQHRGVAFVLSAPAPSPAPVSEASADEIAAGWAKARAKHETAAPATAEPGTPDAVAAAGWDAARARHGFGPVGSAQKGYDHDD